MIKYVNALIICDISHHKMLNHMEERYLKTMKQTIPDFIAIRFSSSYGMLLHRPALSDCVLPIESSDEGKDIGDWRREVCEDSF